MGLVIQYNRLCIQVASQAAKLRLRILGDFKIGWRHSLVPSLFSRDETLAIAVKNYAKAGTRIFQN